MQESIGGCLFMTVLLAILMFVAGLYFATSTMRNYAIAAKVAHWEVNPTTGESKFVYETNISEEKKED